MAEEPGYRSPKKKARVKGRNSVSPSTAPRVYLNCPYAEKEECKKLGGMFDFGRKKWYALDYGGDMSPFDPWLPRANDANVPQVRRLPSQECAARAPRQPTRQPTAEQQVVISCSTDPSVFAAIIAGAGTGKTTTLVDLSNQHKDKAVLYCAFNKEAQLDASKRFGPHVECMTLHSLALQWFRLQHAGENIAISNDNFDRFEDLGPIVGFEAEGVMAEDYTSIGYFVWSTMEKFCQSAGHEPLLEHIPAKAVQWHDEAKSAMYPYVEWAHNCFKVCANIKDTRLPIKHDIYLKCAQLNGAQFVHRKMGKLFEIVLLDEAQDVSECQSALVRDQHDAARFLIGDPHQSIYQFRGSDHALERVRSTLTNMFKLQTSFRFGQNIERAANLILWWKRCVIHIVTKGKGGKFGKPVKMNLLGGKKNWETNVPVHGLVRYQGSKGKGTGTQRSQPTPPSPSTGAVDSSTGTERDNYPCTIIGRTNKGLIDTMVDIVTKHLKELNGLGDEDSLEKIDFRAVDLRDLKIGVVGKNSIKKMKGWMERAIRIQKLKENKPFGGDKVLARFRSSFEALNKWAEDARDQTLLMLISWVEGWGAATESFAGLMLKLLADTVPWQLAKYRFSTVHQSKGLEFKKVRLANDFSPLVDITGYNNALKTGEDYKAKPMNDEVFNLWYVAVTRAERILEVNGYFKSFVGMLSVLLEAEHLPKEFLKEDPCPVPLEAIKQFVEDFA
jgi:superfamily I DNA/RNA helicase